MIILSAYSAINAAILALTLAERLAAGHPNVDPFVVNGVTIEQIADLVGPPHHDRDPEGLPPPAQARHQQQARPC